MFKLFINKKLNSNGMTMVEVMMGFVILGILLAGLTNIIFFSSNMIKNSVDIKKAQEELSAEAYKTNSGAVVSSGGFSLKEKVSGAKVINLPTLSLNCFDSSSMTGASSELPVVKIYSFKCNE